MTLAAPKSAEKPPKPPLVFRVGIVGHRPRPGEPLDTPSIARRLTAVFGDLSQIARSARCSGVPYDHGTPATLVLVSALAEGADQLAAATFVGLAGDTDVIHRLEVAIPFSRDIYTQTFETHDAVRSFEDLIKRAAAVFELQDWAPPAQPTRIDNHRRDRRYETVGDIVLRQSDVLLAVWDGEPARGRGGTADTVIAAIGEGTPVIWIDPTTGAAKLLDNLSRYGDVFSLVDQAPALTFAELETAVARILIPPDLNGSGDRSSNLSPYLETETVRTETAWRLYDDLLAEPARRYVARKSARNQRKKSGERGAASRRRLRVDYVQKMLDDPQWPSPATAALETWINSVKKMLGEPWSAADAIATLHGNIYRSTYLLIFALGAAAVVFGLFGLFFSAGLRWDAMEPLFSSFELAALAIACLLYWVSHRKAHHSRWLNARALSEQFRAHWPLAMLGLGGRRSLGATAQWNAWLFNAHAAGVGLMPEPITSATLKVIADGIRQGIVLDQIRYHQNNHARLAAIHRRLEAWGGGLLILAICVCSLLLALTSMDLLNDLRREGPGALWPMREAGEHIVIRLLSVAAAILPTLGAAAAGIRFQGDFERFSERSEETGSALERIDAGLNAFILQIEALGDSASSIPLFETLRDLTTDLERILLSDLEDWRFVYRARPVAGPE